MKFNNFFTNTFAKTLVAACALALAACGPSGAPVGDAATYVLTNGRVYTLDEARPWAEAVAIRGDEIVFVGGARLDELAGVGQEIVGTAPCMPPEVFYQQSLDGRADLFSLGVLLYECLAGFRPFDGGHDLQTIEHARNGLREPLQPLAPNAPPALVDAVEALLEPQPEGRPLHAAALLERLDACPPPALARRHLGALVTSLDGSEGLTSLPGLAKTRPAPTQRPRRRLPSRA